MQLVALSRSDISRLLAVMTGHWLIGVHASRLGLPFNYYSCSCKDRGNEETVFHLLWECPALTVRRRPFLGRHMFSDLGELSESRIGDLLSTSPPQVGSDAKTVDTTVATIGEWSGLVKTGHFDST
ncbi:hypothetical protein EVAR_72528_1 [Eumeta japonica]|uniref:Uncharacterized protein n=1 Tax=Eumeta variegata TaxID=151549 RepID=A0A4C1SJ68_EUMVA|nr:hypothetical protein EVAR_72528_1 [Eumeta japonica]